jgi:Spy/CpxP family protein refolding chaperone
MNRALQWKLIAGFVLVFLAGGVTGAFVGAAHARYFFFEFHRGVIGERMRDRLQRQLDLTPEQVAKISPVIDKTAAKLQQVRRDTGQRVREIMTEAHQQMATNLTEGQRQKLQQLAERHGRWRRHPWPRKTTPEPPVSPPQNSPPKVSSK